MENKNILGEEQLGSVAGGTTGTVDSYNPERCTRTMATLICRRGYPPVHGTCVHYSETYVSDKVVNGHTVYKTYRYVCGMGLFDYEGPKV